MQRCRDEKIRVCGKDSISFLQVRRMVGAALAASSGRMEQDDLKKMLTKPDLGWDTRGRFSILFFWYRYYHYFLIINKTIK